MDSKFNPEGVSHKRKERNFAELQLNEHSNIFNSTKNLNTDSSAKPVLVVQSPKTPTLSRKLKAISLDSDAGQKQSLDVSRDVSSVPNTPKKQAKAKEISDQNYGDDYGNVTEKSTLAPHLGSNLQRYASNQSISGSQTLKTLPEIMTLQEFSGAKVEPIRIKAKGLLERRGSNASLTIDLGSNLNLSEQKPRPVVRLNTAKSASNLNLTSFGYEKCVCTHKCKQEECNQAQTCKLNDGGTHKKLNHSETCGNCTIYESVPSGSSSSKKMHNKHHENTCKCTLKFLPRYYIERHCVCNMKCRRKSLSNENLYVPPCNFCHFGSKDCHLANRNCNRGSRKALYPRQTYIETSQLLSEDFKLHLQNVQYLQTAGCVLSVAELKTCCQMEKLSRLHQEFWEVPLNLQEKCLVSGSQSRNRYKGVLPNEHSRVHLPGPQNYIHANYIKGPDYTETAYIATQGPMLHTCEDFWHMVWSNKVYKIVMLTALVERGRNKCELYFPLGSEEDCELTPLPSDIPTHTSLICDTPQLYEDDTTYLEEIERKNLVQWGPYTIKYLSKESLGECVIRKLELSKSDEASETSSNTNGGDQFGNRRVLLHYWYQNWADHKQANPQQVLQIALHVLGLPDVYSSKYSVSDSANSCSETTSSTSSHSSSSNPEQESAASVSNLGSKFNFDSREVEFHRQRLQSLNDYGTKTGNLDDDVISSVPSSSSEQKSAVVTPSNKINLHEKISGGDETSQTSSPAGVLGSLPPVLVHCSAGIGRTGCFLAVLNGIQQLRSNYNVDVLAIVCSLRLNRGGMVQTAEQYELIHRVLSLYADHVICKQVQ